jgi:DNA-binding SARP family transcriptional activator
LEDLTLPDCPEFDEWQYGFREELRREFAWVLEKAALGWSARGDWEKAAETARRWVRLDRLDARAQLALTGIYARSGQRSLAQRTYEEYARLIQNTFDQEPEEAVKEQFRTVLSQPPQSKAAAAVQAGSYSQVPADPGLRPGGFWQDLPAGGVGRIHPGSGWVDLAGPGG